MTLVIRSLDTKALFILCIVGTIYMFKLTQLNSIYYLKRSLVFIFIIFQSACSVFGIRSEEEAKYKMIFEQDEFQLRQYEPMLVAETVIDLNFDKAGKVAFGRLFDYISGENLNSEKIAMTAPVVATIDTVNSGQKIAMTAPVITEKQAQGWRYYFVLPNHFSLSSAPAPINPQVAIKEISSNKVAVIQYSGLWDEHLFNEKSAQLKTWMIENNYDPDSLPRFAGYDPPWTLPFLRRNEVLIDVKN